MTGPEHIAGRTRLVENLTTGVVVLDHTLHITYLNPAAEQLLGSSRRQLVSRTFDQAIPGLGSLRPMLERVASTGEDVSGRELRLNMPRLGGAAVAIDCTVSRRESEDNQGHLLVELSDASRRLRISRESALLAQQEVSRAIVRRLAHEIRNPLGGIRGAAQLLERELSDPAQHEYTQLIIRESDRLAGLTDSMLGTGGRPQRQSLNVHELIEHVYQLLRVEAPETVRIERDYDPSLPNLRVDRSQVIQVILNVARNALRAVPEDGSIVFRSRALTNHAIGSNLYRLVACVELEDNGPGIPEALRETLFYPLVSGRADGTGLGLALAQDLIRRQNGLIEVASHRAPTRFRMLFPIEETDER